VLETVIRVLEQAGDPMQVREIHAAAEQLAGEPLLWKSVKAALAVNAEGDEARFERVRRGHYRIKRVGLSSRARALRPDDAHNRLAATGGVLEPAPVNS
jgi:hypothetical protein